MGEGSSWRWGESETGRKRKYYSLKKDGKAAMDKHHEQWSLVHSVLGHRQNWHATRDSWESAPYSICRWVFCTASSPDIARVWGLIGCSPRDCIVRQDGVDTSYAVDDLGDPQIGHQASQGQSLFHRQLIEFADQLDHFHGGLCRCSVQVRMEAEK